MSQTFEFQTGVTDRVIRWLKLYGSNEFQAHNAQFRFFAFVPVTLVETFRAILKAERVQWVETDNPHNPIPVRRSSCG